MEITILSMGQSSSGWEKKEFDKYKNRLPNHLKLSLIEIPLITSKKRTQDVLIKELNLLKSAIPKNVKLLTLCPSGTQYTSKKIAKYIQEQQMQGEDIYCVIGGPEGLHATITDKADINLSLSSMTFPHTLCRVIMAEQIYRSFCIHTNHPYAK